MVYHINGKYTLLISTFSFKPQHQIPENDPHLISPEEKTATLDRTTETVFCYVTQ